MIIGEAAGVVAALTAKAGGSAVQDVDVDLVAHLLRAEGAILGPSPEAPTYGCQAGTAEKKCLVFPTGHTPTGPDSACNGDCPSMQQREWLALRGHFNPPSATAMTLVSRLSTVLKKSEALSWTLPSTDVQQVGVPGANVSVTLWLEKPPVLFDDKYYLIYCANTNCSTNVSRSMRQDGVHQVT